MTERLKPFPGLRGESAAIVESSMSIAFSFRWKFEIVLNDLAQQARQKRDGKLRGGPRCGRRQLFWPPVDTPEMLGLKIARLHDYKSSLTGLPCDCAGEKPMIAPRLGTRSMDCIGSLKTTPWRTPAPSAIIHVVRLATSPVR